MIGRTRRFGLGGGLALLAACFVGAGAWATTNARGGGYDPAIRPSDVVRTIDNRYLPFKPGTTLRYEGNTAGGVERVEIVVLRTTRRILDVNCLVVRDTVTVAGKPEELTFDWYAQDRRGNVWYFGEDSRDFRNGKWVVSNGSWQAGVDGAKPGIVMLARPRAGRSYRQEYYPGHAEDMARVVGSVKSVSVPYGTFKDVLVTREWTPLEPGIAENKYYAPGLGEIRTVTVKGGSGQANLVAVSRR